MTTINLSNLLDSTYLGYTGSQGEIGFTGSSGFTGSQGDTGFVGSQGDIGFTGSKGDIGFTGSRGDTGFTGSVGFTGSKGDTGFVGSRGDTGFTGSVGFVGSKGDIGFTGSRGDTGFTGSKGDTGFTGSKGALQEWTVKTANYTLVDGDRIIADTSGGSFIITLPATPTTGAYMQITDGANFANNALTVARNGSTIEGISDDILLDIPDTTFEFVYDGSTWQITATTGAQGEIGFTGSQGPTNLPVNSKSADYTLQASDVGKYINITSGNVTVPSGVFSDGDVITVYNNKSSTMTIIQGASVTQYFAGTNITGTLTLSQRGIATILCVGSNTFVISGAGLY
jgi:hypothetical protein